ncbi:hypothetical protein OQH61_06500 [Helicobacter sp. MIT 21-1697]|uniref:hypothetical protein n=1 Tax=Helicobacter sp. MIT 21-1697 TaxID=2993733 RepID=UPI00224A52CC|nr:hypothetical protein [Helicobacter sp. MIT 21-1697]MCX2717380.1 hypothetical protein [Helicobacter sp. MIT 21-1697]
MQLYARLKLILKNLSAKKHSGLLESERNSSISSSMDYPQFCALAAQDSKVFEHFRTNPIYTAILEHISPELGQQYLNVVLQRNCFSMQDFENFKRNDLYGGGGNI